MNQIKWYGRQWWLSLRVLFLACFVASAIGAVIQYIQGAYDLKTPVFLCIVALAASVFNAKYFYYFGVMDDELIIRNHVKRWHRKSYRIQEIKSIRMEYTHTKVGSNNIRIFITPASYELYYAATLTGKSWRLLAQQLEAKGLRVNNFTL